MLAGRCGCSIFIPDINELQSGKQNFQKRDNMRPSIALNTHREEVRDIVLSHRVQNVRVFGSVLHGTDTDDSDLDILVDPTPETTLMDIGAIRLALRKLLGIPVDVLTPRALPSKFRDRVIEEAKPL